MNIINNRPTIIGIDHGYGNIKTASCCFKPRVASFDKEPTFKSNLLVFENRYYLIGEEHKEFTADKMADSDYYILTSPLSDSQTDLGPCSSRGGVAPHLGQCAERRFQEVSASAGQRRLHFPGCGISC